MYITIHSTIEFTIVELKIWKADYKFILRLSTVWGLLSLISALFKDQVYIYIVYVSNLQRTSRESHEYIMRREF